MRVKPKPAPRYDAVFREGSAWLERIATWEYRITRWHGEGRTLYYVIRCDPHDDGEWEAISSWGNQEAAEREVRRLQGL